MPDYTLGTWRVYLTREGEVSEFELGEVIIANVRDPAEIFRSYEDSAALDTKYYVAYRDEVIIRVAVETVNPRLLDIAFNTTETPIVGGYQLVFESLARQGVFKVRMVHEMSCRDAELELVLHRAGIAQPVEMPWSQDTLASAELEFHAMLCPNETEPFGYLNATGDFAVGAI